MAKEISLTQGKLALVDDEDYDSLIKHKWYFDDHGYAKRRKSEEGRSFLVSMHRELLGVTDRTIQVDHINGNRLDNRRLNLRLVSQAGNSRNMHSPKGNNPYIGVYHNKKYNKFVAQIGKPPSYFYLGWFSTAEEAAKAYNAKAEELGYLTRNPV